MASLGLPSSCSPVRAPRPPSRLALPDPAGFLLLHSLALLPQYPGVPHTVFMVSCSSTILDKPKSPGAEQRDREKCGCAALAPSPAAASLRERPERCDPAHCISDRHGYRATHTCQELSFHAGKDLPKHAFPSGCHRAALGGRGSPCPPPFCISAALFSFSHGRSLPGSLTLATGPLWIWPPLLEAELCVCVCERAHSTLCLPICANGCDNNATRCLLLAGPPTSSLLVPQSSQLLPR